MALRVLNVEAGYYDKHGFHPLRGSHDYDPEHPAFEGRDYGDVGRALKPRTAAFKRAHRFKRGVAVGRARNPFELGLSYPWYKRGQTAGRSAKFADMSEAWKGQTNKPQIPGRRVTAQESFYQGYLDAEGIAVGKARNPSRGRYSFSVRREGQNRWALKKRIYSDYYQSWIEQPDILYGSKSAATSAGSEWLKAKDVDQNPIPLQWKPAKVRRLKDGKVQVMLTRR